MREAITIQDEKTADLNNYKQYVKTEYQENTVRKTTKFMLHYLLNRERHPYKSSVLLVTNSSDVGIKFVVISEPLSLKGFDKILFFAASPVCSQAANGARGEADADVFE